MVHRNKWKKIDKCKENTDIWISPQWSMLNYVACLMSSSCLSNFHFYSLTTDNARPSSPEERSGATINPIYHSCTIKDKAKSDCELYETADSRQVYHCPGDEIRNQPPENVSYSYAIPHNLPRIGLPQCAPQPNQSPPVYHVLEGESKVWNVANELYLMWSIILVYWATLEIFRTMLPWLTFLQ